MAIIDNLIDFFLIKSILLIDILIRALWSLKRGNFIVTVNKDTFKNFFQSGCLISEIKKIKKIKVKKLRRKLLLGLVLNRLQKDTSDQYLLHNLIRKESIELLKKNQLKESEIFLKISVVMPVFNTNLAFLKEAVGSVMDQIYPNWELCVVDDCSSNQQVTQYLKDISKSDKRFKVFFSKKKLGIANATNKAIQMASSKWIAFLDHDDLLSLDALLLIARTIKKNKKA